MKRKIIGAASVVAVAAAIAMPAGASADMGKPPVNTNVNCPTGVFDCVQALANWAYDTATNPPPAGTAVDAVCTALYGKPCPTP
jgi:hypothetical protein